MTFLRFIYIYIYTIYIYVILKISADRKKNCATGLKKAKCCMKRVQGKAVSTHIYCTGTYISTCVSETTKL